MNDLFQYCLLTHHWGWSTIGIVASVLLDFPENFGRRVILSILAILCCWLIVWGYSNSAGMEIWHSYIGKCVIEAGVALALLSWFVPMAADVIAAIFAIPVSWVLSFITYYILDFADSLIFSPLLSHFLPVAGNLWDIIGNIGVIISFLGMCHLIAPRFSRVVMPLAGVAVLGVELMFMMADRVHQCALIPSIPSAGADASLTLWQWAGFALSVIVVVMASIPRGSGGRIPATA